MIRTAKGMAVAILVFLIGIASLYAQSPPSTNPPDIFLDVSFEQKKAFIDDIRVDEISIKSKKNVRAASIESISKLPMNIAILLDASGSLRADWDLISEFYKEMIEAMPLRPIDSVSLMFFREKPALVQRPTSDKALLINGFSNLIFSGGSSLFDSVLFAGKTFAEQEDSRRAMIVITDGEDKDSRTKIDAAYKEAIANNVRVYLFLIRRTRNKPPFFLRPDDNSPEMHKKYVTRTGGKVFSFSDLRPAQNQIMQMLDELSHLKRIKFSTEDPEVKKSGFEISVSRKGVKAYYPSSSK